MHDPGVVAWPGQVVEAVVLSAVVPETSGADRARAHPPRAGQRPHSQHQNTRRYQQVGRSAAGSKRCRARQGAAPLPLPGGRGCRVSGREHCLGDGEGGHGLGPAGVEGEVGDGLDDLALGEAVVLGQLERWKMSCSALPPVSRAATVTRLRSRGVSSGRVQTSPKSVNDGLIRTLWRRVGSSAGRNTSATEGCGDGQAWEEETAGPGDRVLAAAEVGDRDRGGVPGDRGDPQDRVPVAGRGRRVAPVVLGETARTGRFLSLLERQQIATLRARGLGVREIARRLDRSPSTISRELRRNLARHDQNRYDGDLAHARARQRARRVRSGRLSRDVELRDLVQALLEVEWSPAQVAAHLRLTYPTRSTWHVCHETIYQALYHRGRGGLSRQLTRRLRTGRPLRKARRSPGQRRIRFVAPALLIDHRPAVVDDRGRIGDWEGDLIVGRMSRSAIGTLVDRRSRLLRLVHLPDGHSAAQLRRALLPVLTALPGPARQTLT